MEKENTICIAMKRLQKEQKIIAEKDMEFQFIQNVPNPDTIPIMLFGNQNSQKPFSAFCIDDVGCFKTNFFRLEKLDEEKGCATLSLLEAVDMDGCPVEDCDEIYSLLKTKCCVTVDLRCLCIINPLSPDLVNRPLPIIEPK
ncbi:MAG TPA: hypothetical protein GX497_04260 [Bacillus bacterium]|nr:hypothetical protein [Bacillus sp. (in: firmicutes)]